jgi:hypothetical protein
MNWRGFDLTPDSSRGSRSGPYLLCLARRDGKIRSFLKKESGLGAESPQLFLPSSTKERKPWPPLPRMTLTILTKCALFVSCLFVHPHDPSTKSQLSGENGEVYLFQWLSAAEQRMRDPAMVRASRLPLCRPISSYIVSRIMRDRSRTA